MNRFFSSLKQNSKRTLRSNEIALPVGQQLLDTELDLSFALQYPHYLKQWDSGNRLQVSLVITLVHLFSY